VQKFIKAHEEEEAAGIAAVTSNKSAAAVIYNIAGQKVDGSYKGLGIKNGKKFFVK
jgi:hypothetical protein